MKKLIILFEFHKKVFLISNTNNFLFLIIIYLSFFSLTNHSCTVSIIETKMILISSWILLHIENEMCHDSSRLTSKYSKKLPDNYSQYNATQWLLQIKLAILQFLNKCSLNICASFWYYIYLVIYQNKIEHSHLFVKFSLFCKMYVIKIYTISPKM